MKINSIIECTIPNGSTYNFRIDEIVPTPGDEFYILEILDGEHKGKFSVIHESDLDKTIKKI